jgi:CYTH domain-containing protein
MNEIERKFFVEKMPDLAGVKPLHYERYFLKRSGGEEERISKVNDGYFYEKKTDISELERARERREISFEEFSTLKQGASDPIIRDRYDISEHPKISIQVYRGKHEGLVRAEVEFASESDARNFVPPDWMGKEMTALPIARDAKLLDLSEHEFRKYILHGQGTPAKQTMDRGA